jgi:hypothetical protein
LFGEVPLLQPEICAHNFKNKNITQNPIGINLPERKKTQRQFTRTVSVETEGEFGRSEAEGVLLEVGLSEGNAKRMQANQQSMKELTANGQVCKFSNGTTEKRSGAWQVASGRNEFSHSRWV